MKPTGLKRGKVDRKFGQKLFLKPFRGDSPKAAFTRRAYKPGAHGQSRVRGRSRSEEYGLQLLEKQKIRAVYGISDKTFKRIVQESETSVRTGASSKNVLDLITENLEQRLDSVVFRGGLAPSRSVARQLISHGHIMVNGRRSRVRSIALRKGDTVAIRQESRGKALFADLAATLKKHRAPNWITVDADNLSATLSGTPEREVALGELELSKVVEFYAR
jgi:small subunit ribosomal protein S4